MSGLWLNETQFMHFGDAPAPLSEQIATRSRSLDWQSLSGILPNPDTVLRRMGKSIQVYRDLRPDVDVGNGIRRRKAAVTRLERGLDRNKPKSAIADSIADMMKDWDWDLLLGELQNAALFGYSPVEIVWEKVGKYMAPTQLIAKPPEWFTYDTNNEMRFLSKNAPFQGEELPERKFVCARQEPSYINPYGFPDLSMCFWPAIFRKGGMKFWVTFTEKFGMPWVIGKSPRGTQRTENRDLLNNLFSMVQDAVAVIPDDSSVEIMQGIGQGSNGDQYEKLIKTCTRDINVALLGQNQTTESDTNRASATAGHGVTDDIRDGHISIICSVVNTVIRYACELNFDSNERPQFDMWEQETINVQIAERDLKMVQAGAKLTQQYFERTYGLQPGDQVNEKTPQAEFADPDEPETVPEMDAIDAAIDGITTRAPLTAEMQAMLNPLFAAIKNGVKPDELMAMLTDIYPDMDTAGLQERLARAIFVAKLWGKVNALD
jgi:phage gp29-like protein